MFTLEGRIALVTGAGRGLGLAIAQGLAGARARGSLNGRDGAMLEEACAAVGEGARALRLDVADSAGRESAFARLAEEGAEVDILVNCVAIRDRREAFAFAEADPLAPLSPCPRFRPAREPPEDVAGHVLFVDGGMTAHS